MATWIRGKLKETAFAKNQEFAKLGYQGYLFKINLPGFVSTKRIQMLLLVHD